MYSSVRRFIDDESGGYTIWSLIWFSLYVAMGGLAVDITDAYRTRTLLQSTADAAALAGAMSLPDKAEAVNAAVGFAESNMLVSLNGNVVDPTEVHAGNWDRSTHTFTVDGTPLNAVYVLARRASENENPLATSFLRIIGMQQFDINVEAVAMQFVPDCLIKNGLVAANRVDVTSGGGFRDICVHGQNLYKDPGHDYAIDLNNGNVYGENVQVSMPDMNGLNGKTNLCDNNDGLCDPGTLVEGDLWPKDLDKLAAMINSLTNPASEHMPGYMFQLDGLTGLPINPVVVQVDETYAGPYLPYHIYDVNCSNGNKQLNLPSDVVLNRVVIVADCVLHSSSGGTITESVLASSALGNGSTPTDLNGISFAKGWTIGTDGFCTGAVGPVSMFTLGSMQVVAETTVYGLRAVAGGTFRLTAKADVAGISAQAKDIIASAGGDYTYCGGTFEDEEFVMHYRLVR